MFSYLSYLAALIASLVLAIYAFTKRELTETGTVAAIMAGATVFAFDGWVWFALTAWVTFLCALWLVLMRDLDDAETAIGMTSEAELEA